MPNVAIFYFSVPLNIVLKCKKGFRDPTNCSKYKFQEVWAKLESNVCFLRQPVKIYLAQIYNFE